MENKKYTLLNFLKSEYSDAISFEIPIIQRDYAQGRSDERSKEIRKTFLGSLIAAVENYPQKNIELDFVYGKRNKNKVYLLDGQQRITTLYLLHWYLAQRLQKPSLLKGVALSYRVRQYADEFTQKISDESTQIDFTSSIPSQAICNCTWFFDAWKHDPTVKGMLNTLDTIHELLKDKKISEERYWQPLEEGAVTFYWLDLEEHHLTDELYLKMNARGKQLSNFENFKASLVKRINDEQWESEEKVKKTFSYKMDTIYTNLFWEYRGGKTIIDEEAMNFFAGMAMIAHALKEKNDYERIEYLYYNPLSVTASDFSIGDFELFKKFLDFYSKTDLSIETPLWDKDFKANSVKTFFKIFIKDNKSFYKQRVFFYTISLLFKKREDKAKREDFIRVVRNIIENVPINSKETFVYAIKLMSELLKGVEDIYSYLSKTAIQSNFASYQVTQEKQKAERIVANPEWKDVIWEAEDHPMFKGDIGFLLLETENDLSLFKKRYEVAKEMFDENGVKDKYKENMLLIRALVATFDEWDLLTHGLTYDCEKDTWKEILEYDRDSSVYFLKVLDNPIPLEELVKQPSKMKDYEEPHQDLYQTSLLEAIQQRRPNNRGFTYHYWKEEVHILYPPYYSGHYYGCIIGEERNKKLAQAVAKGIINTEQQLEWNDEKLPFFWGWNVHFTYDDKEYVWWYNGQITQNGQDCKDDKLLEIFK